MICLDTNTAIYVINRCVPEIVESLELALDRFRNVAKALGEGPT